MHYGRCTNLKVYYKNQFRIGERTWISQKYFLHSAGGILISKDIGIGPGVRINTPSRNLKVDRDLAIMKRPLTYSPVGIGGGSDSGGDANKQFGTWNI